MWASSPIRTPCGRAPMRSRRPCRFRWRCSATRRASGSSCGNGTAGRMRCTISLTALTTSGGRRRGSSSIWLILYGAGSRYEQVFGSIRAWPLPHARISGDTPEGRCNEGRDPLRGHPMPMRSVYLDYASTTPMDPRVLEAMHPFHRERFGNPSSVHAFGQSARQAVDEVRESIARAIGARDAEEIVFTSGATEADNFALIGAAYANEGRGRHLIISPVEHHAVLEPAPFLESRGFELTLLPVDGTGRVDPDAVRRAIPSHTTPAPGVARNNEIGPTRAR